MPKVITYTSFAIASALVVLAFVTAKSYSQLAVAVILYPALTFFALKIFQRKGKHKDEFVIQVPKLSRKEDNHQNTKRVQTSVVDIDKRTFLKLIGATGITVFLASLLGKRAEGFLFNAGGLLGTGVTTSEQISASQPISGYRISEVDESGTTAYYGFINQNGGWLIMRDETTTSSFRYAKGDFKFPETWEDRKNLNYDYFYNLF